MRIRFNITDGKAFAKIVSTFDADVKELLAYRTTVTNPIRIS